MTALQLQSAQTAFKSLRQEFQRAKDTARRIYKTSPHRFNAFGIGLATMFLMAVASGIGNTLVIDQRDPGLIDKAVAYDTKTAAGQPVSSEERAASEAYEKKVNAAALPETALCELAGIGAGLLYYRREKTPARP